MLSDIDFDAATPLGDIASEIADELAERIRARFPDADVSTDSSNSSISAYVEALIEDELVRLRVSDHQARSSNHCGDFEITLDKVHPHTSKTIDLRPVYFHHAPKPIEFDENGGATGWDYEWRECADDDDDAELQGYRACKDDVLAVCDAAMNYVEHRLA